eukprot:SAG22_NODE_2781_length_2214_cov_3.133806_2_plen_492_part_00
MCPTARAAPGRGAESAFSCRSRWPARPGRLAGTSPCAAGPRHVFYPPLPGIIIAGASPLRPRVPGTFCGPMPGIITGGIMAASSPPPPPPPLSREEVAHFKEFGFVIKRGYLDPQQCAKARDWVWTNSHVAKTAVGRSGRPMDRGDPSTWVGPFTEAEDVDKDRYDTFGTEYLRHNRWIVHQFGSTEAFIDVLPRRMMGIAEQLTGKKMTQPVVGAPTNKVRWGHERGGGLHGAGMYATCPMVEGEGEGEQKRVDLYDAGIHVDGLACNLGCVGYICDVPPDGGGFAIWPRSHRRLHRCFENAYAVTTNEAYIELQKVVQKSQPPFIFDGKCGDGAAAPTRHILPFQCLSLGVFLLPFCASTRRSHDRPLVSGALPCLRCLDRSTAAVIIYHHRMFHWASQNFSANIRMALFYDFVSAELRDMYPAFYPADLGDRPAGQRSALADGPPPADMWRDWSTELRDSPEPPPLPELVPVVAVAAGVDESAGTAKL